MPVRLSVTIAAALVGALLAASAAFAAGPPQPPPIPTPPGDQNPWPAKKVDIAFYVETVTANKGESIYGKWAPLGCTQTNFFARGERVVFHIGAVDAHSGTVLTNKNIKYAYLKIPGMDLIKVTFTPHGKDPATAPWTFTGRWDVPNDYPLGAVPFQLVMKLKKWGAGKIATFSQLPLAPENLTVIDHR